MKKSVTAALCALLTLLVLVCVAARIDIPGRSDAPIPAEDPVTPENTEPEEPVAPEGPDDPAEPTDPEDPEDPEEPEDPAEPEEPDEPDVPVEPEEPDDPVEPVEPTEPEEPDDPVEPVEPVDPVDPVEPTVPETAEEWLAQMTLREKVGQVFWILPEQLVPGVTDSKIRDSAISGVTAVSDDMRRTLDKYPAGGFVLFARNIDTPAQLKALTGALRSACKLVPVITVDEEGGRVARIANHSGFDVPNVGSMESLAADGDPSRVRSAAAQIGAYLASYGFTMDLAPVADVNSNPRNVVIGDRAFGSDPETVATMVGAYVEGLHSRGVRSVLKHFPGHGDTEADSHRGDVIVSKTWDELLTAELIPFMHNLDETDAVMVAHILLPNITDDDLPASLSRQLIRGKLRGELGYNGLVLTDSLDMGAVTGRYGAGQAAVLAFEAGNDVLLIPENYAEAFESLLAAVESGRIPEERLDESVLRILRMKLG